ncbi:MAG: hypothetical protein RIS34_1659 [Pseudomonadota bacterium]
MFKRAASLLDFSPRDGELVEVRGRLGVYEPRGDLQLIVESMSRAGQGNLFEQFLKLKTKLESEGLFEAGRKRSLPPMPRGIGVVTSLGAAALHDVVSALQRRVPHIPVVVVPALVQGTSAAGELAEALSKLYLLTQSGRGLEPNFPLNPDEPVVDVILLVRGGGSMEDLWAFNDERLARTMVQSPVPIVTGVGHETDFTIADFVADLRAPTPTAAAELVAQPRAQSLDGLENAQRRLVDTLSRQLDSRGQRLDLAATRLGRPLGLLARQQQGLQGHAYALRYAQRTSIAKARAGLERLSASLVRAAQTSTHIQAQRLSQAALRLQLLDPSLVLQRGYALVTDSAGQMVTRATDLVAGQNLHLRLAQGQVGVTVTGRDQEKGPH